jgi:hypothetical protein
VGKVLRVLGMVWLSPATLVVWVLYISWAWAIGYIRYVGAADFGVALFTVNTATPSWYSRAWKDWVGWSGPCVVIVRPGYEDSTTMAHELRHCQQQLVFGVLHYPIYGLCSAALWVVSTLFNLDKHAYLDNPFERDARRAAGQPVDIPREQWTKGPDDRWPWW